MSWRVRGDIIVSLLLPPESNEIKNRKKQGIRNKAKKNGWGTDGFGYYIGFRSRLRLGLLQESPLFEPLAMDGQQESLTGGLRNKGNGASGGPRC